MRLLSNTHLPVAVNDAPYNNPDLHNFRFQYQIKGIDYWILAIKPMAVLADVA
jgi:hypothetical protein